MFTGIIKYTGTATPGEGAADGQMRLQVAASPECLAAVEIGASVAVDGVCLTAVETGESLAFDVSAETLARTTLGAWRDKRRVNLEHAMRLGDEIGGHFVSGHVDAAGTVVEVETIADGRRMRFETPAVCSAHICYKGSVCVNGVSLTVSRADDKSFEVHLIPYTLEHTNLGELAAGDAVNLEIDLLGRYLSRLLECRETA